MDMVAATSMASSHLSRIPGPEPRHRRRCPDRRQGGVRMQQQRPRGPQQPGHRGDELVADDDRLQQLAQGRSGGLTLGHGRGQCVQAAMASSLREPSSISFHAAAAAFAAAGPLPLSPSAGHDPRLTVTTGLGPRGREGADFRLVRARDHRGQIIDEYERGLLPDRIRFKRVSAGDAFGQGRPPAGLGRGFVAPSPRGRRGAARAAARRPPRPDGRGRGQ